MRISEILEAAPSLGPPTGFAGAVSSAFKQGTGMNPNKSLAANLAGKALNAAGLQSTASTVKTDDQIGQDPNKPASLNPNNKIVPGSTIRDPRYGNIKVLPNAPGQKGVHLDTKRILGFNVYVDPKDIEAPK